MGITLTDYLLFGAAKIGDIDDLSVQIFRRKVLQWGAIATAVDVVVRGVPPLVLPQAVANGIHYINAYGGLLQSGVPSGYTLLNGITNGVNTAVATGIQPIVDDVEWELRVKPTTDSWYILQARSGSQAIWGVSGSQTGPTILLGWNGNQSLVRSGITRNATHIYYVKATVKNGVATLYVKDETDNTEDTQTTTYTFDATQLPSSPFYLFANGNPQYVGAGNKVFMARIKVGGVTVMDYVPALNPSNVVGFYDNATNTFKVSTSGTLVADQTIVPTPSDPVDLVCNNGVLKILDKSAWTIFTNPTSIAGQGVFISSDGKWYSVNDRGAGCAIPLTIGKQYTLAIHKKTADLGTILRYGQSPQGTPTLAGIQLTDWYRGEIADGMMISFVAKQAYFVMQFSSVAVEAGMVQEAVEVLEAQGSDYTFVDSITASGTQYIDTGILAASDIKAEVKYKPTNTSAAYCALGGRDFSSGDNRNAFGIWANVSGRTRFDFQSNSVSSTLGSSTTNWNIAVKDGVKNYFNGTQEESNDTTTFASTRNMYLFGMLSGSSVTGNMVGSIAYCRIWKAGVLVRDFMPAIRNSDNVVGMYDTVSGTFFENQGTGVFVAGTVIGDGEVLKLTPSNDTAGVANLFKISNYVDTQEILTGLINHQLGIYVFDGTEDWTWSSGANAPARLNIPEIAYVLNEDVAPVMCSHFIPTSWNSLSPTTKTTPYVAVNQSNQATAKRIVFTAAWDANIADVESWKTFLATQYAAGTPVIIVYPLVTAQDEVAPVPQTMQTIAGDNVLEIVQAGMSGLEVELKYTKGVSVSISEIENANIDSNVEVVIS